MCDDEIGTNFFVFSITSMVGNMVVTIPVTSWSGLPERILSTVFCVRAFGISFKIRSITCYTVSAAGFKKFPALLTPGSAIKREVPASVPTVLTNFLLSYLLGPFVSMTSDFFDLNFQRLTKSGKKFYGFLSQFTAAASWLMIVDVFEVVISILSNLDPSSL